MSYTKELCNFAFKVGQPLSVVYFSGVNRFVVCIECVAVKDGYMRPRLQGKGTTIEDACYDYLRLARGANLVNLITDEKLELI